MNTDNTDYTQNEQLETQAKTVVSLLDEHASRLSMRTLTQLEEGRNKAVARHQQRQGAAVNADGTLSHWVAWADHHRLMMAGLVLAVIIGAFIMLQTLNANETSDAFLLGADLPPEAFVDMGFEPSLNNYANM